MHTHFHVCNLYTFIHIHTQTQHRYKKLEEKLNDFSQKPPENVAAGREAWLSLASAHGNPAA